MSWYFWCQIKFYTLLDKFMVLLLNTKPWMQRTLCPPRLRIKSSGHLCSLQICNVGKFSKRHPQPCKYFRSGSCRFKESCKYEHEEKINTKELLDRIIKFENEFKDQINAKGLQDNH